MVTNYRNSVTKHCWKYCYSYITLTASCAPNVEERFFLSVSSSSSSDRPTGKRLLEGYSQACASKIKSKINLLLNLRSPRDYVGSSVRSRLWYLC